MTTPKIWTASDIKMGTLQLSLLGPVLYAIHGYSFIDATGEVIEGLPTDSVSVSATFANLDPDIQAALTTINTFMYDQALAKEGMQ